MVYAEKLTNCFTPVRIQQSSLCTSQYTNWYHFGSSIINEIYNLHPRTTFCILHKTTTLSKIREYRGKPPPPPPPPRPGIGWLCRQGICHSSSELIITVVGIVLLSVNTVLGKSFVNL